MSHTFYCQFSGLLFFVFALGHFLRIIFGWPAVIGDMPVPFWVSYVALIIFGYLAYEGRRAGRTAP